MRIALYGRDINSDKLADFEEFYLKALESDVDLLFYYSLAENLQEQDVAYATDIRSFETIDDILSFDFVISIGGDGTFLRAARFIGNHNIPIAGINTGRLGFLAEVPSNEMVDLLNYLTTGRYTLTKRSLLHLEDSDGDFHECQHALNEIAILRRDTSSLIVINVYLNSEFLNSYWADGLIISTPTGSTAYNMSAGGPIIYPGASNIVITPIAPHSLTVRPIVLPDDGVLTLKIESRSPNYLVSVDSHSTSFNTEQELSIRKADFELSVVQLDNHSFYDTLRAKLMWGNDKRNS